MSERDDIPRISSDTSDWPDDVRDLFRSARDDDPDPARIERLWQALQPVVGGQGGGTDGGPTDPGGGSQGGPGVGVAAGAGQAVAGYSAATLVRYALAGAGITALVLATNSVWLSRSDLAGQPALPASESNLSGAPASPPLVASAAPDAEPPIVEAGAVDDAAMPRAAAPASIARTFDAAPAESEAQFLQRAHAALRSGNASEALAMASDHARLYPSGLLSQERELIIVEALVSMGRRSEAVAKSEGFLQRYPASAHARRLRTILGIPSENAHEKKDPANVIIPDGGAHSSGERIESGDAGR